MNKDIACPSSLLRKSLQSKIFKHRPGSRILYRTYFHRYHLSLSNDVTICKPEHTMKVVRYALRTQFSLFNRLFRLWNSLKYHAANLRLVRVRLNRAAPNGPGALRLGSPRFQLVLFTANGDWRNDGLLWFVHSCYWVKFQ